MRIGVQTGSALASVLVLAECGHAATHAGARVRHIEAREAGTDEQRDVFECTAHAPRAAERSHGAAGRRERRLGLDRG